MTDRRFQTPSGDDFADNALVEESRGSIEERLVSYGWCHRPERAEDRSSSSSDKQTRGREFYTTGHVQRHVGGNSVEASHHGCHIDPPAIFERSYLPL